MRVVGLLLPKKEDKPKPAKPKGDGVNSPKANGKE